MSVLLCGGTSSVSLSNLCYSNSLRCLSVREQEFARSSSSRMCDPDPARQDGGLLRAAGETARAARARRADRGAQTGAGLLVT